MLRATTGWIGDADGTGARQSFDRCPCPVENRSALALYYKALLHDKTDPLRRGNIVDRVARHGDNVGHLPLLKGAETVLYPQQFRVYGGGSLECGRRTHSQSDHNREVLRVHPMRKD